MSTTTGAAASRLEALVAGRSDANERFFAAEAERLARLCHAMAERFARGGRLLAFGASPADRSDVRHVAVEFVHPVIVGKRALPALGAEPERVALLAETDDVAMAFGTGPAVERAVREATARGCLTVAFAPVGAAWELVPPVPHPFVAQELAETAYHVLWELVHVFFEHRGLLAGRDAEPVFDSGASSFLYPFLAEREDDLGAVLADVAASATAKAAEVSALRERTLAEQGDVVLAAAGVLRARLDAGGRLLALGNGGSATDAMDAVADFTAPPPGLGWPARRAIDLAADPAILTAIANDVGPEAIFARQVIAYGRPGDLLLAISTSGGSANVLAALAEARRRGLATLALVGYDGGRIAAEGLADHVVVCRSEHIPRIQEAQATVLHALRELVEVPGVSVALDQRRVAARVYGVVQGVGFRPYVFRLAAEHRLAGWVRNDARGVELEVEGAREEVDGFLADLPLRAPPLARLERVGLADLPLRGDHGFAIRPSEAGAPAALVSADAATCPDCLAELHDPDDRRFRYPFLNCTNCGPRFTIVRGVPYDRPLTTMAGFAMCEACQAEYDDPADRRFHAQPNACPVCGPRARLLGGHAGASDAVAAASGLLRVGAVLAVKGLGGYHLACRADDERAVASLRARKHREAKPFALLVRDLDAARELAVVNRDEAALLASPARPIVLVARRPGAVAPSVAPASRELGLMLPYTPLHHLLAADAAVPLVLTSGNVSDEPIAFDDDDAIERLGPIADAMLLHDRPIRTRTDDSVARVVRRRPLLLRRSRGFVPEAIALPVEARGPVLACGAALKATTCLAAGRRAWVSHHIGDLGNLETLAAYRDGIAHFERLFDVTPEVVAHDLHPDYLSTAYAVERPGVRLEPVQHHHAHLAAVLAEHGETGPAVGAIYDGAGLGADGTVWGGELLAGGLREFVRAGHLLPVPQPGGDRAARQGWRMACAWLAAAGVLEAEPPPALRDAVAPVTWRAVSAMARTGLAAPATTSAGRLFDAVAALCGVRAISVYEGQAAIELEARADPGEGGHYAIPVGHDLVLDPRPAIRAVARDAARGVPASIVAARFHRGLAEATARACAELARRTGTATVVLGGGVWANRVLLEATAARLEHRDLRVLVPERLPPGDGGLSYGQAAVAAARS